MSCVSGVGRKIVRIHRLALLVIFLLPNSLIANEKKPLNVLFIAVDDLRPELGCYGVDQIQSPNIDRLAKRGVVFNNAYCQFALCNPSRSSLMTGWRPERIGVLANHIHFRKNWPKVVTLPQYFKNHGYHTEGIGKLYHGPFPKGSSRSIGDMFDDPESWSAGSTRFGPRYYYTPQGIAAAKKVYQRLYKQKNPSPDAWTKKLVFGPMTEAPDVADNVLYDGQVAEKAIASLQGINKSKKPFFLALGFIKPHTPFVAPKKYWDLYDPKKIALAENPYFPNSAPSIAGHRSGEVRRYTDQPKREPFSEQNRRRLKRGYYACVSYIDAQIGRVLDELDRLKLRDHTIVVLYGDHGWHLGEHKLWGKVTNFEIAARAPLIISLPSNTEAKKTNSLVEFVDIYPTICDAAGLKVSKNLDGISLMPILANPKKTLKDAAYSQMTRGKTMGYTVRTSRYRYTQWINRSGKILAQELYDQKTDPQENKNIAELPENKKLVKRLAARLQLKGIFPGLAKRLSAEKKDGSDKPTLHKKKNSLILPQVFQDHMVLQRGVKLPIWGKANPGQKITVTLGSKTVFTKSNKDGRWRVDLPAQKVNAKPQNLVVRCETDTVTIKDVLIGEVWVCAGQSNMEWPLSKAINGKAAINKAGNPMIRLLNLPGAARGGSGSYTAQHLARLTAEKFCQGKWQVDSPQSAKNFSAVAYFFALELQKELQVPIGLISPAIGGTPIEAWIRREAMAADLQLKGLVSGNWLENKHLGQWCRTRGKSNLARAIKAKEKIAGDDLGPNHSFKPCFMWQAGIKPLIPFAIRGVIWYQGESNALSQRRVVQHGKLFPLMVRDWRKQWSQGDFPFLYVQLPSLGREQWPLFRDQQRRFLKQLPNVGMAVTMDVGHPTNVHPTNKKPVGVRLARLAFAKAYKQTGAAENRQPANGPLYRSIKIEKNQIVVSFDSVRTKLTTSDKQAPRHFQLAAGDEVFHAAVAKVEGKTIRLTSKAVPKPKYCRYAWSPFPKPTVNLINSAGLPASPFTSRNSD